MTDLIKLVIGGSMGAGKTSAIQTISGTPPVRTEAPITQDTLDNPDKTTTTVAMDYGELPLDDGRVLVIFGTPGQTRYDFMCRILAKGALGLLILIDHTARDPVGDLHYYMSLFGELVEETGCVVGITHVDLDPNVSIDPYVAALGERAAYVPVRPMDPRKEEDIVMALQLLLDALDAADAYCEVNS